MSYSPDVFVADEQPTTAKWNKLWSNDASFADGTGIGAGVITPEKLLAGAGTDWDWDSWTPTLSGRFDNAKWSKDCVFIQIGKTVFFRMKLTATTTTPMSGGTTDCRFTLPVTAKDYGPLEVYMNIGSGGLYDASVPAINAAAPFISQTNSTTEARIRYGTSEQSEITSTLPWTWTTNDQIFVTGMYEAA